MPTTSTEAPQRVDQAIAVAKADLFGAWSTLEKVVVSLHKMGSYYATPSAEIPLTPERRKAMLDDLDAYLSAELMCELSNARTLLSQYLPNDEAEAVSDELEYWQPRE